MSVVPEVSYALPALTHNLCNAQRRNGATSLLARARWLMRAASEAHPSPAASVCPTRRISTIVELRLNARLARREDEINQTLRLSLMLLNHQTRIALTTTTNKIVSLICALRKNHLLLSEASSQAPFVPLLSPMHPPIALGCSALPWPLQRQYQQP
jgi:hypothetical protein